jgi:hypothetical protein
MDDDLNKIDIKSKIGKVLNPKTIFIVLVVILVVEVVIGVKTLLSPVEKGQPTGPPDLVEPTNLPGIVLSANKDSFKVGEEIELQVNLTTGEYSTDGTDVVLGFDPQSLEPMDKFFEKGSIYQDYPGVRKDLTKGTVFASGISVSSGFKGSGVFGTFKFKAKKVGKSIVELKFTKGLTTDSNIIESKSAKDLLEQGAKVEIKIGTN